LKAPKALKNSPSKSWLLTSLKLSVEADQKKFCCPPISLAVASRQGARGNIMQDTRMRKHDGFLLKRSWHLSSDTEQVIKEYVS